MSDENPYRDPTAPSWDDPTAASPEEGTPAETQSTDIASSDPGTADLASSDPGTEAGEAESTLAEATQSIDVGSTTEVPLDPFRVPPVTPPTQPYAGQSWPSAPGSTPGAYPPPPGQPPAYGQAPYGAPPQPYGAPPQPYGMPAYGQTGPTGAAGDLPNPYAPPGPGQQPSFPTGTYGRPVTPTNVSAVVLVVVSGLSMLMCCVPLLPALIFGIVALTKNSDDPEGSRKVARWGWIAFGVGAVVSVLIAGWFFASFSGTSSGYSY